MRQIEMMFLPKDMRQLMQTIYLDHNATTPLHPQAREAMQAFLDTQYGNPSAPYELGQTAHTALDNAREQVARTIGAQPGEVFFTSGGTEADNWALRGVLETQPGRGRHIITSQIEHHAILRTCQALERLGLAEVTYLPVNGDGLLNPTEVAAAIRSDTGLISVMAVNNETGVIQPFAEIGRIARQHGILFHTDAVQAVGKMTLNLAELPIDLLSLSAHKLYAPKGVGALFIRHGLTIAPLLYGGQQERGRRSGTENLPAIVGFGMACELLDKAELERIRQLRDAFEINLRRRLPNAQINGQPEQRVGNTSSIAFHGFSAEALLLQLDRRGIAVSNGSACASGSPEPSHVLKAMGYSDSHIRSTLRFSFGRNNTAEQIDHVIETLSQLTARKLG